VCFNYEIAHKSYSSGGRASCANHIESLIAITEFSCKLGKSSVHILFIPMSSLQ